MKVKELIEVLQGMDADCDVILQGDAEGNSYSHLSGASANGIWIEEHGDCYDADWSADDADMEQEEWDKYLKGPRCAILWPC